MNSLELPEFILGTLQRSSSDDCDPVLIDGNTFPTLRVRFDEASSESLSTTISQRV